MENTDLINKGQYLFINCHPITFSNGLNGVIPIHHIERGQIVIELTEQEIHNPFALLESRNYLKRNGYQLAIDDFSENTDISLISILEPNFIKLDRSLICELEHSALVRNLVKFITQLCKEKDIHIIAEGIENKSQLELINDLEIQLGQGYFLGKPLEKDKIKIPYSVMS